MAEDLTALGPLRLPVERYDFTRVEQGSGRTAGDLTSLGAIRLPGRRFTTFTHGVTNDVAESRTEYVADTVTAQSNRTVGVTETATAVDARSAQGAVVDAVNEVFDTEDAQDAGRSRANAAVTWLAPPGHPGARPLSFNHPGAVEEAASAVDLTDAAGAGEVADFCLEAASAVDARSAQAVFAAALSDDLDAFDTQSTGGINFGVTVAESVSATDTATGLQPGLDVVRVEVAALVDTSFAVGLVRAASRAEAVTAQDDPGIQGDLFSHVSEILVAVDRTYGFGPGIVSDGTRTIHVAVEDRELAFESED
jgi:hypothetical protein